MDPLYVKPETTPIYALTREFGLMFGLIFCAPFLKRYFPCKYFYNKMFSHSTQQPKIFWEKLKKKKKAMLMSSISVEKLTFYVYVQCCECHLYANSYFLFSYEILIGI